ncbi:MAG: 50S ribosomal protein L3 [Ignavibacteriales bacterium]|nr:50S ribosomal protein L3 [Ignavibacteriaceae bacterium]NLH62097.1 50S ribosomal protein L3 [Ignavibacteriales bacterium]HOJ17797.1 50S ribosomal protein L3 [Ignavibacteriaceae bacterium]HPO55056.1 50S ribosomal protein L3 [Ignavibacteriaceae bacterium]
MPGLIGKKLGMSNIFDDAGNRIPVTMIQVGPCKVVGVRTAEKEGYNAVQLGFGEKKKKNLAKPQVTFYDKNNLPYSSVIKEFRTDSKAEYKVGDELNATFFSEGDTVKVRGFSKGKGFQGVMRRHGFGGVGGTTHGQSDRLRAPGSIGASSYPSRVFKGQRMAGRTGNEKVTVANLKIVKIIPEKNVVLVKGAVPGAINSILEIHKK